jgi:hypothetical protein
MDKWFRLRTGWSWMGKRAAHEEPCLTARQLQNRAARYGILAKRVRSRSSECDSADSSDICLLSKESCPVRPIPAYKAGLYGLTENRQLSNANTKPAFIPVHRTGFSACLNKGSLLYPMGIYKRKCGLFIHNAADSLVSPKSSLCGLLGGKHL